jgi:imidazolonepropionase-like amidohydrolase
VIRDVTVLPMTGERPDGPRTVIVRDGRIAEISAVAATQEAELSGTVLVIDGSGRFLVPGLIDAHVHINRRPEEVRQLLDLFLLHGVTTIVNLEGSTQTIELRDRIARGEELGPTIITSGPIIRGSPSTTEAQGREIVARQAEAGYDLIKVYNPLSAEGYHGVIEEARRRGLPVIGHAVRAVGIEGALQAGQHIAHMEEAVYGWFTWRSGERDDLPEGDRPEDAVARLDLLLDEDQIPELARRVREAGIWVTPNLVAYQGIVEQTRDLEAVLAREEVSWMPESMRRAWQPEVNTYVNRERQETFRRTVERTYPFLQKLTVAFHRAGVPLLAGTDVGIPVVVAGLSLHRELELLVEAGLDPTAALEAASCSAAELIGREDLGRIVVGSRADLVLLAADPREDIRNTRRIDAVVVGGRLLDRAAVVRDLGGQEP